MELRVEEGRIYGARYYTVQPLFNADPITWFRNEWDEMVEWSVETYGPTPVDGVWTPGARWYTNNAKFWFRSMDDAHWFILRWQ